MYFTDPSAAPAYLTSHTIVTMLAFLLILNLKEIRKKKKIQSSSRIGGRSISSSSYKKQEEKKINNDDGLLVLLYFGVHFLLHLLGVSFAFVQII